MNRESKVVTVSIACSIKADQVEIGMRELKAVIKKVLAKERECRGIVVYQEPNDVRRLLIIEHWDSKEHFLGPHMQTLHMVEFLKISESFLDGNAVFNFWNEVVM